MSKIFFVMTAFTTLASCEREQIDTNSPAYQISESEKLVMPAAIDLPANSPSGNSRVATYYAVGVQKYKAQAKPGTSPAQYEWAFVAPRAILFDASNYIIGTHTAGPTWQLSASDSIYAQHFAPPRTSPSAETNTIDWLLLMPKAGKVPTGVFANVAYIQRIATRGGKAPTAAPVSATDTADVHYTAIYRFSRKNP